jgi:hypothetical protein
MGGYAEYAFGKSGNFIANYTYAISLLIANIAIAISAVGYGTVLFGVELTPVQVCIATIVVLWVTTVLNFGGAKITGQIGSITVWGVIIPVVGLCVIGWFWFSPSLYVSAWNPNNMDFFSAISTSISMTLWAFLGWSLPAQIWMLLKTRRKTYLSLFSAVRWFAPLSIFYPQTLLPE